MSEHLSSLPSPVYVSVDGADIATYTIEPRTTPVADVVFCHGTPWSAEVWATAARHLGMSHRVFLWDMPGYGRSTKNESVPVDLLAQIARYTRLIEHWGLQRPHVIAHDIGAAVALGSHLLDNDEYTSLYLWDPVIVEPWGSPFFQLVACHTEVFAKLPTPLHTALVETYIAGAAHNRLTGAQVEMLSAPWIEDEGQSAFYRQIASLHPEHTRLIEERLGTVRCRVRIGWGEEDPWIPASRATVVQDLLPGHAEVVTVAGVGHLAPIEAPGVVHRELEEWLVETSEADA